MVRRLTAGANGIRTIGPPRERAARFWRKRRAQAWIVLSRKDRRLLCGTSGYNLVSSSAESASQPFSRAAPRLRPTSPRKRIRPAPHPRRHGQGFDLSPAAGKIGVALGECPEAVHIVGQDDPGIDKERGPPADLAHRVAHRVDVRDNRSERRSSRLTVKK
jgi:hypothetical protein